MRLALALFILSLFVLSIVNFLHSMTGMAVANVSIQLFSPTTYSQASDFYIKVKVTQDGKPVDAEVYAELDGKRFQLDKVQDYYIGRYFVGSLEELSTLKIVAYVDGKEFSKTYVLKKAQTFLPFSIALIIIIIGLLLLLKLK